MSSCPGMRTATDIEAAALLLVAALLLDDYVASDDAPVELLQLRRVFANPRLERGGMRHVPNDDLQRYLHASVSRQRAPSTRPRRSADRARRRRRS